MGAPVQGVQPTPLAAPLPAPVRIIQSAPFVQAAPAPLLNAAPLVQPAPAPLLNAAPLVQAAPAPIHNAAVPATVAPVPVAIPATPSSQFHAQDEFGQFNFGYQNINSNKQESRNAFGVTRGSYQYMDANGILQTTHYISDPVNGFRVAATNLPVAVSTAPEVAAVAGPPSVAETPEVAAARAAHLAAHADAKAAVVIEPAVVERKKREAEPIQGDYEIP